jgi:hypothetical protein
VEFVSGEIAFVSEPENNHGIGHDGLPFTLDGEQYGSEELQGIDPIDSRGVHQF